nr:MAG TPA: hypothetical protein [Caudoviricetes sp.]DAU28881.1 MAG TPA: hypothetical protein [Caudoviricetes sp.]DAX25412.1 MAG TPA: hypothetical protein [Caudoviricetes sp.]
MSILSHKITPHGRHTCGGCVEVMGDSRNFLYLLFEMLLYNRKGA